MKLIIIRAIISISLSLLSYITSLLVDSFNLPILLVLSFTFSQCVNECLSYCIKEKEENKNKNKLIEKDREINSLKDRIHEHYNDLDNIYDSLKIPAKEKKQIKSLRIEMLTSITYKHSDGNNEKHNFKSEKSEGAMDVSPIKIK